MAETQLCTKCGVEKTSSEFSWKNKKKLKRRSMCKACGDYSLTTLKLVSANCHRRKTAKERSWHIVDLLAEYNNQD